MRESLCRRELALRRSKDSLFRLSMYHREIDPIIECNISLIHPQEISDAVGNAVFSVNWFPARGPRAVADSGEEEGFDLAAGRTAGRTGWVHARARARSGSRGRDR